MTKTFLSQLNSNFALIFAGQGTAWAKNLKELGSLPKLGQELREILARAAEITGLVALEMETKVPGATWRLRQILEGADPEPADNSPAISGPGIALTQLGALAQLYSEGIIPSNATALAGHSQGTLGVSLAQTYGDTEGEAGVIALAMLIGHAAASAGNEHNLRPHAGATPMLAISGEEVGVLDQILDEFLPHTENRTVVRALRNSHNAAVFSGNPAELAEFCEYVQSRRTFSENKPVHASALQFDWLRIEAPFHNPVLEGAYQQYQEWAKRISEKLPANRDQLARQILLETEDWESQVRAALKEGARYFIDLGPSTQLGKITQSIIEGSHAVVVDGTSVRARMSLAMPGYQPPKPIDWSQWAPKVVKLPNGRTVVDTAFTRLTGKSPIILPGMTPTTVDPEIVAAAANAGNWAELAGGGQYSAEVFENHHKQLRKLLKPGCTAAFNTMFFDRFMWNLQFGVTKIVPKARREGSPIDAVTIAAGIPEVAEADELIRGLVEDGFSYICFKPGTVEQIKQVLEIADANPDFRFIVQVEDGHSGGHHSWEDLDYLLLQTYGQIRRTKNVVLAVGGGIATPAIGADYIWGTWAEKYGRAPMPVDAVLVGTVAMACAEAKTSPQVKELLKSTAGVDGDGWVGRSEIRGGMTSGLSHLGADMHEIANSSAAASALIHQVGSDPQEIARRRAEIISALDKTAKPYFGDVAEMTYAQWLRRFVELSSPWADPTWQDRAFDLFHRVEARLHPADHGEIPTLFAEMTDLDDAQVALERLLDAYPCAEDERVSASDAAWFPVLCRKHHKPLPFVPVLDTELAKWWGTDTLWQSQDPRFSADAVRVIPGPRSVAGIDRINEPVGELFARFEDEVARRADSLPRAVFARLRAAEDATTFLRACPSIEWAGNVVANPACLMPEDTEIVCQDGKYSIVVNCRNTTEAAVAGDTHGEGVQAIALPLLLPSSVSSGGLPVIDMERLSVSAYDLLAGAAGVGTTTVNGDEITALPGVDKNQTEDGAAPFGTVKFSFTWGQKLGISHRAVTGGALSGRLAEIVPDALVGPVWPAIYAALGSAKHDGIPVIEGLVNAVHLDHTVRLVAALPNPGETVQVVSQCGQLADSSAGRVVTVRVQLRRNDRTFAHMTERFAIRGRIASKQPPAAPPSPADNQVMTDTPRSFLRRVLVNAPADMTAFAKISGDFNPIHVARAAAGLSGLSAPLVHGMWLSATVQHAISASGIAGSDVPARTGLIRGGEDALGTIAGWTYQMHGMVNLGDQVEITVERVGHLGTAPVLEATCRIDGQVVSIGRAVMAPPVLAYVYPGQGIQRQGMGMEKMTPVMREVWQRADRFTRSRLGFSIEHIVRANPTEITVKGKVFRHSEGVLNLTQFTQVALATLAYAQTQQLRANGVFDENAVYAGHSLGEYNALSCCAGIFPFEQVLEIVFQRGSAMHHLVSRDASGASNYRLGALRPDQMGISEDEVAGFVRQVAHRSGEFLQIVNLNLAGKQYAIAGTIAGMKALEESAGQAAAKCGGERPFMLIPGIDVPFHSEKLQGGVASFKQKLQELIPADLDPTPLIGRYIPNLVAKPFALTKEFAESILQVVPAQGVQDLLDLGWEKALENPHQTARTLLIELLAWQFASPVRWIETQDLLFTSRGGMGVDRLIEVGLGAAPTLANLASRTLALPSRDFFRHRQVDILNVERDAQKVNMTDVQTAPVASETLADTVEKSASVEKRETAEAVTSDLTPAPKAVNSPSEPVAQAAPVGPVPVRPREAMKILLAWSNKVTTDQIEDGDTVDVLTGGVSSKRNQLLMDMAAELGVPTIEGATEATMDQLFDAVDKAASGYVAFGQVLEDAITATLRKLFGGVSLTPAHVEKRVRDIWGLGADWTERTRAQILLGTRGGDSVRGGQLATLPQTVANEDEANALVDQALQQVAAELNVALTMPGTGSSGDNAMVDSAALANLGEKILGADGVLANNARQLLHSLGIDMRSQNGGAGTEGELSQLVSVLDAELGQNWVKTVTPAFDPARAVLLDDRWAWAKEDLARVASGQLDPDTLSLNTFVGAGEQLRDLAKWYSVGANKTERDFFERVQNAAMADDEGAFAGEVALVTGAAPHSIAAAVVARLLEEGATVIITASSVNNARLSFAKELYARHARPGAALWLVPANMASLRDVDSLIQWIGAPFYESVGGQHALVKPALRPSLFFPFAAPRVYGTLGSDTHAAIAQERLLLWSVERAIYQLANLDSANNIDHRVHVVLPGSPNRGIFGGDGAYGGAKAAFDTIVNRWHAETGWSEKVTLAHPRIGWVQGTSLMGGNDRLVPAVEAAGVHVYKTSEIALELLALASKSARQHAKESPLVADLTGGLAEIKLDFAELAKASERDPANHMDGSANAKPSISALPTRRPRKLAEPLQWGKVTQNLDEQVVIVGIGDVSTWGSGRTRAQAELGDGEVELTAAGVLELAWMMNLVHWAETPTPGWYDQEEKPVEEAEIFDRFHDQVLARCGIREVVDDSILVERGSHDVASVYLQTEQTFPVNSEDDARAYLSADSTHTEIFYDTAAGTWMVTKKPGALVRVPRKATLSRFVGGQMPTDFDPAKWGIPATMVEALDRMAVWNLVTAVDAFTSSGFSPAELLRALHPADVSSTQGTGIGGMESLRKVFLDRFLGEDRPQDILQEALPNVVAAHTMQSYIGGYGQMVHPVGACATAAVSIEDALDKIRLGKSDFVVAGGIDDISVESLTGFGNMNATADTQEMLDRGISPDRISRAGDRRRGGFLEAQGGGTVLLTRGSIAADLGLPVLGVVAYARSFADGAHTSIPAPGLGAVAAGRGGDKSELVRALTNLGLDADDLAVVSKHDTSTKANDPNEAELHSLLAKAWGRSTGNPLYVVSQKTVTGHAKGGSAVFQTAGLVEIFTNQRIPGNRCLDCLDPQMRQYQPFVWLRRPLDTAKNPVKAGLLTSLGFGHVAALIALVHPSAFETALQAERGVEDAQRWRKKANARLDAGSEHLQEAMLGRRPLFEPVAGRRLPGQNDHEVEVALLLNPTARLGIDGLYHL
ncbi:MAG: DUF1729 domain-containing protein [Actinomycetaceae bacterium]|nr:DUF1729 domain-containing protein [Actinomycetaceae bacterium]